MEKLLKENGLPRKSIVLLNNTPLHPEAEELHDGDIKARFLPPNVTVICQPMDQDILEILNKNYDSKLLLTTIKKNLRARHDCKNEMHLFKGCYLFACWNLG